MMNNRSTFSELLDTANHHHCIHPWADLWINAAGHVSCCPQNRTRFGNIYQHGIEQLWNSEAAQTVRRLIADGDYLEENIFRYPLHDSQALLDRFQYLADYSRGKGVRVDGLSGLGYRLRQCRSEPPG